MKNVPGEDLGGRVDDVLISNRIVANMDLGVTTIEHQIVAELRNLNITMIHCLDSQTV